MKINNNKKYTSDTAYEGWQVGFGLLVTTRSII